MVLFTISATFDLDKQAVVLEGKTFREEYIEMLKNYEVEYKEEDLFVEMGLVWGFFLSYSW